MDGWRRVELPGGASFPTRRGSPIDAAFTQPPGLAPMTPSLGVLGDLMWTRLPETRPYLADRLTREVEDALDAGRPLALLVGDLVPDALWHPVLRPTLDDHPRTRDGLAVQLAVVREAYLAEHPDQAATRYALVHYVFGYLWEPRYRAIVEEVDAALAALVASVMTG